MAWNDEPPTKLELSGSDWAASPPTKEELGAQAKTSVGSAILHGLEQGASLNYYDELAGAAEGVGQAIGIKGVGGPIKDLSFQAPNGLDADKFNQAYTQRRDQIRNDTAQAKTDHPGAYYTSDFIGGIAPSLLVPEAKSIKGAAAIGAGLGTLGGAGASEGHNAVAVGTDAAVGGIIGGIFGTGAGLIGRGGENVKDIAETKAFKAAGPVLKDFRRTDDIQDVGRFMLDNKLVKAGDTFGDVAEKATALQQKAGDALGRGYDAANIIISKVDPKSQMKIAEAGFNPMRDKAEIMSRVSNELGYSYKAKSAVGELSNYLDELIAQHGDQTLNPQTANQIKTAMDQSAINYARNPLMKQPESETAVKAFRSFLGEKISNQIGEVGKAIGDKSAAAHLAQLNETYGMATKISNMSYDREMRETANQFFGLGDKAAGGISAAIAHGVHGNTGAAIAAAGGAVANKTSRLYGNAALAAGLDTTSQLLEKVPILSEIARVNPAIADTLIGAHSSQLPQFTPTETPQQPAPPPVLNLTNQQKGARAPSNISTTIKSRSSLGK